MDKVEFEILNVVPANKKLIYLGSINATQSQLEAVLGPATAVEDTDKLVTTKWIIHWTDSSVAEVYDWKETQHNSPEQDEIVSWHVAGTVQKAYTNLVSYIA